MTGSNRDKPLIWSRRPERACVAAWIMSLALLGGCGYTNQELFPQQYQAVASPIFDNATFYKSIEFDLAEALSKEIERRTPYKVAPPALADTAVEGTITNIDQRQVSRSNEANLPQIMEIEVTLDYRWKDLRTGKTIVDRSGFTAVGQYVPSRRVGEPFETAQHGAVERLAGQIVDTMRRPWPMADASE